MACNAQADILNNNPGPSFTSSPPPISPSFALFAQPSLLPEVVAEFLDPIANPFSFAYKRRHPICVMKRRSQSKERDNGGQLMEEQKGSYVSQRRVDQWGSVALQKLGQARSDTDDSRASLLGSLGLDVIWLGRKGWTPSGSQGKSRTGPCSQPGS